MKQINYYYYYYYLYVILLSLSVPALSGAESPLLWTSQDTLSEEVEALKVLSIKFYWFPVDCIPSLYRLSTGCFYTGAPLKITGFFSP